jgi:hypothetical protein
MHVSRTHVLAWNLSLVMAHGSLSNWFFMSWTTQIALKLLKNEWRLSKFSLYLIALPSSIFLFMKHVEAWALVIVIPCILDENLDVSWSQSQLNWQIHLACHRSQRVPNWFKWYSIRWLIFKSMASQTKRYKEGNSANCAVSQWLKGVWICLGYGAPSVSARIPRSRKFVKPSPCSFLGFSIYIL